MCIRTRYFISIGFIMILNLNSIHGQIISASVSDFGLFRDGRCHNDQGNTLTAFSFNISVSVTSDTAIYKYSIINGDNRSIGNSGNLTGAIANLSRPQAIASNIKSIAPYRIVLLNSSAPIAHGSEIDFSDVVYSSHFFNPYILDPDCPNIICKSSSIFGNKTYETSPQSQSPPIFIKNNLSLENFSLSHNAEFYAGSSITLEPGYDSGPYGTVSAYGIEACTNQNPLYQCWDLNQNGQADISEDINNDGVINSDDCN